MDRKMLKEMISLSVPAIAEYTLHTALNYADYIMVGKLGVEATTAIGITREVTWLLKGSVSALGIGVLAFIASETGAGRKDRIKTASVQAVFSALILGIIMTAVILILSPFISGWVGAGPEMEKISNRYFLISNLPYIFLTLNMVLGSAVKATGNMKTPLAVNGIMNVLNIIFNFFFIYESRTVSFGSTELYIPGAGLGVTGAAMGTALSTVLSGIMMTAAVIMDPVLSPRNEVRKLNREILGKYIRVGIPSMLTSYTTHFGRVIFTAIVAQLGTVLYSAHTIAFTAEGAFYIPCVGMMSAVSVMAGKIKGEENLRKLNEMTRMFCLIGAGVMTLVSVLMFVFSDSIFRLFTNDPTVLEVAPKLLKIAAVNEPFFAVSLVLESVFNGIGKTKLPFAAGVTSQWIFRIGGSVLCLRILKLGVEYAWICMISDNIFRCIFLGIQYFIHNGSLIYEKNLSPGEST